MPEPIDQYVGRAIHRIRIAKNLTLTEVADKIGVSYQQVHKYEAGSNRISASKLAQILEVLKVPVSAVFPAEYSDEVLTEEERSLLSRFRQSTEEGRQFLIKLVEELPN